MGERESFCLPNKNREEMATVQSHCGNSPGLPDGLFLYQKSQFGYSFEGLGIVNVGLCIIRPFWNILLLFGVGMYYITLWDILLPFDIYYSNLGTVSLIPEGKKGKNKGSLWP
jgi:hypothetical protein